MIEDLLAEFASPAGCAGVELAPPHSREVWKEELAGLEPVLSRELTGAVVSVYGEWVRPSVEVRLIGIPTGRRGRGGAAVASAAPSVTFGMREEVFAREDADRFVAQLVSSLTQTVSSAFGDECRDDVLVELVGQPTSRSGLGGRVISGRGDVD